MVILDTSIIIDHLRLKGKEKSWMRKFVFQYPKIECAVSLVTVQELYTGKSTRESIAEEKLLATLAPLTILAYTYEIAQKAGEVSRDNKNGVSFADAAIAATAILQHCPLATLNTKDFSSIESLTLFDLHGTH